MLTFNGITFPGVTQTLRPDAHVVELQESKIFGIAGKSVIADRQHGRTIRVRQWLNNFATPVALQNYLETTLYNAILGRQGTLRYVLFGTQIEQHEECVCVQIDPSPDDRGALPDISQNPAKWHRLVQFVFEQTS